MNPRDLIPVAKPSVGLDELAEVKKVFDSNWLGLGKWVFDFENRLKEFLGAKNIIAVNTGTTALHLALDSIGIKEGDEVIVPSLTFVATIQAIMLCRAKPVFCEVYPDTLNINIEDVRRRITSKTKVIIPVHYGGLACEMDRLLELAEKHKLRIVEDAAHAFGSFYKNKKIGSFGDITCFSFDPIKNITCGEGGAIVTGDDKLSEIIREKRILGISKDTWSRYKHKRSWFYTVNTLGFRYHMSNINAAIGLIQLNKFDKFIERKKEIVRRYDDEFKFINNIELLSRNYDDAAPFNYIIKIKARREKLMDFLKKQNIESGVHYIPNHLHPFFAQYKKRLPITEKVWKEIISLPLYYGMSDADVHYVIKNVKKFFRDYGKRNYSKL